MSTPANALFEAAWSLADASAAPNSLKRAAPDVPFAHKKARAQRWSPSDAAKHLLEATFVTCQFPGLEARDQLAAEIGCTNRQIQVWFQNRRQRDQKDFVRPRSAGADIDVPVKQPYQKAYALDQLRQLPMAPPMVGEPRFTTSSALNAEPLRQRSVSFIHSARDRPIIRPSAPTLRLITHTRVHASPVAGAVGSDARPQQQDEGGRGEEFDRDFGLPAAAPSGAGGAAAGGG